MGILLVRPIEWKQEILELIALSKICSVFQTFFSWTEQLLPIGLKCLEDNLRWEDGYLSLFTVGRHNCFHRLKLWLKNAIDWRAGKQKTVRSILKNSQQIAGSPFFLLEIQCAESIWQHFFHLKQRL